MQPWRVFAITCTAVPIGEKRAIRGLLFSPLDAQAKTTGKVYNTTNCLPISERGRVVLLVEDVHVQPVREVVHQDVVV